MKFFIFYVDENGNVMKATNKVFEADSKLDALHKYADYCREDPILTKVGIVNDDPDNFILFLEGYVENREEKRFDLYGDTFEYFAEEE